MILYAHLDYALATLENQLKKLFKINNELLY